MLVKVNLIYIDHICPHCFFCLFLYLMLDYISVTAKCLNLDRCVIYMPRIELWAVNENLGEDVKENHISPMSSRSLATSDGTKSVSEIWNAFVEQVDSASTSACLIVLVSFRSMHMISTFQILNIVLYA